MTSTERYLSLDKKVKEYNDLSFDRLIILNAIIYTFYYLPFFLIGYYLFYNPIPIYTHVTYIGATYFIEQTIFLDAHILFHIMFKENADNIINYTCIIITAYLHHYYNQSYYCYIPFNNYLYMYLEANNPSVSIFNKNNRFSLYFYGTTFLTFLLYYSNVHKNFILSIWIFYFYKAHLFRLYFASVIYFFSKEIIGNDLALLYVSYLMSMLYVQALSHLWYHTSKKHRFLNFGAMPYYFMSLLERISVISTERHKIHHNHRVDNMDNIEMWNDLWMPESINLYINNEWRNMINVYEENKENMNTYYYKKYRLYKKILIYSPLYVVTIINFTISHLIKYFFYNK
jgi:hypothetical protein